MEKIKCIALVAHDNRKRDLIEWAEWNHKILIQHKLLSAGTTGGLVEKAIKKRISDKDASNFQ
jgi:methylglyoxal synthase